MLLRTKESRCMDCCLVQGVSGEGSRYFAAPYGLRVDLGTEPDDRAVAQKTKDEAKGLGS